MFSETAATPRESQPTRDRYIQRAARPLQRADIEALHPALQTVVDRVASALRGCRCTIQLLDAADALTTVVASGMTTDLLEETRFARGAGIAGWVAQTFHPIIVHDVTAEPRFLSLGRQMTGGILCVPIMDATDFHGTLTARSHESGMFDDGTLDTLRTYAFSAALVIGQAHRTAQRDQEVRREAIFRTITQALSIGEDPRGLLDVAMPLLFDAIPYDSGVLVIEDAVDDLDVRTYERRAGSRVVASALRAWARATYRRVWHANHASGASDAFDETVAGQAVYAIPLYAAKRPIGLAVFAREAPFDARAIQRIQQCAGLIASAVDRGPLRHPPHDEARYNEMFTRMSDGLLLLDESGIIALEANEAFHELIGIPPAEIAFPMPLVALEAHWREETTALPLADPLLAGQWHIAPNERRGRHLEMRESAIMLDEIPHRLRIFHDATASYQMEHMRAEFLSLVSHELHGPITSVYSFLDMLIAGQLGNLSKTQRDGLIAARYGVRQLWRLVDDMRDLSQVNLARLTIQREPVQMETLIDAAVAALQPWLADARLRIETIVAAPLPVTLADPVRIQQVLGNLLTNAVKFSEPLTTIRVEATTVGDQIRVSIRDTGPGISSADAQRIFRRFEQVLPAPRPNPTGLGLGLAIVHELIELHGGRVWVESTVGQGSVFVFTLPIRTDI